MASKLYHIEHASCAVVGRYLGCGLNVGLPLPVGTWWDTGVKCQRQHLAAPCQLLLSHLMGY